MKIILSPCLYMTDKQDYYLFPLEETLKFADEFLSACLDNYDEAFYNDNRLYFPPVCMYNDTFLYQTIQKHIHNLLLNGNYLKIQNGIKYSIVDKSYYIVDDSELQIVCDYINYLSILNQLDDVIMFVGDKNDSESLSSITINFENSNIVKIPISRNPWKEKSDVFNPYIKLTSKTENYIFPNYATCIELDEEMKQEIKSVSGNSKQTIYKKYGRIIAYRNRYTDYFPKNPYNPRTNYYKSYNGKYIISVDLLHGTFEVFDGKSKLWINEYNFSGKSMYDELTQKIINEMRQNHKVSGK